MNRQIRSRSNKIENSEEKIVSPAVVNPRKRGPTNSKPPSDNDDETIEKRVNTRKSIGQTQLRSYVIRRNIFPKKLVLLKIINVDIIYIASRPNG